MSPALIVVLAILALGAAIGAYAFLAPRKPAEVNAAPAPPRTIEPVRDTSAWTSEAGEEFAGLSEAARCDMVFAVADLDDERSRGLLAHALEDPSETVALAAGHALIGSGRADEVKAYVASHPGTRAQTLMETLALLE